MLLHRQKCLLIKSQQDNKNYMLNTKLPEIKLDTKTLIDTAKEIQAGGDVIHQSVGEISISLDRLVRLLEKRVIKHSNGTVEQVSLPLKEEDVNKLIDRMFSEAKNLLKDIYKHQNLGRKYNLVMFIIGFISLIIIATLIFY